MASMMEQLTKDVAENVISQITGKLLPAISDRYDIPLDDLVELVNNTGTTSAIKAKPKASAIKATPSSVAKKGSTASSRSSKQSTNKELTDLQAKIDKAVTQGKVLNVQSGRPLADTAANRKKYKFYSELGIAGTVGDDKLTDALRILGAPVKKETPVHQQAAKARARVKKDAEIVESESETDIPAPEDHMESDSESEPAPKKTVAKKPVKAKPAAKKKVETPPPSDDEDEDSESEPAPKKTVAKKPVKAKPTKKKVATPPPSDDEDEDSESEPAPKKTVAKKPVKAKPAAKKKVETPPPSDDEDEDEEENVDFVVKLSNLIEEGNAEVQSDDGSDESPKKATKKSSNLLARYNPKIRQWWNPDTSYVLKRKGIKSFVIGKVEKGNVVAPLTSVDLKKCATNGWATDTSVLDAKTSKQDTESEASTSEDEDS